MKTFAEWWQSVEGWKSEGGSGEHKARAAWNHQQKEIVSLCQGILALTTMPMGSAYEMPRLQAEARAILHRLAPPKKEEPKAIELNPVSALSLGFQA